MRVTTIAAAALGVAAALAACSTVAGREEAAARKTTALETGFVPAAREQASRGAPAIAVDAHGAVFVLDAVKGRVARHVRGRLEPFAEVPGDADDLAIGPDGAIAVRRSVKPQILVFDPSGKPAGVVDTTMLPDIDGIGLARSRRVLVTTPYQETFSLGSPSMPQLPQAVLATKREGAVLLEDGRGVAAIHTDDGQLELRVAEQRFSFGKGDAARIVGADGNVVCARVEHVSTDPSGAIDTSREAVCLDVRSGSVVFRTALAKPGAFLPRRELAYAGSTLAHAHVGEGGTLEVTTWAVSKEGGAR